MYQGLPFLHPVSWCSQVCHSVWSEGHTGHIGLGDWESQVHMLQSTQLLCWKCRQWHLPVLTFLPLPYPDCIRCLIGFRKELPPNGDGGERERGRVWEFCGWGWAWWEGKGYTHIRLCSRACALYCACVLWLFYSKQAGLLFVGPNGSNRMGS